MLPAALGRAIGKEIAGFPAAQIRDAAQILSQAYRSARIHAALSPLERAAYLAVRFPSTFAVADRVWREFAMLIPSHEIRSLLDAGAGPGAASLAAHARLAPGVRITQLERDDGWRPIAHSLAKACEIEASFHSETMTGLGAHERHDVVVASYALGELAPHERAAAIDALWDAAKAALVIIEPGTPHGFEVAHKARERVLSLGAHAAAPCTHNARCPMSASDWCHSAVRLERSATHRAAKQAALGYEDEKFAYVIMTRAPPPRLSAGRIVRRPIRAKGHVHLDVCEETGLRRQTIPRSNAAYRLARDATWGDPWPPYDD